MTLSTFRTHDFTTSGLAKPFAVALCVFNLYFFLRFFRYTIASYLLDRTLYPISDEQGCTVWAAAYPTTRSGVPILVKNRDYWLDHRELQILANAHPSQGYKYTHLTSAGSPGVFSSGMNEVG